MREWKRVLVKEKKGTRARSSGSSSLSFRSLLEWHRLHYSMMRWYDEKVKKKKLKFIASLMRARKNARKRAWHDPRRMINFHYIIRDESQYMMMWIWMRRMERHHIASAAHDDNKEEKEEFSFLSNSKYHFSPSSLSFRSLSHCAFKCLSHWHTHTTPKC